ncbi:MAG: hypothetical protein MUE95_04400 [Cyclobacteriaceae bacterium]|jgi:hypothetical protein|nr:hypothetical protein [Cyclobacteriaceae bacterium]
MYGRIVLLLFLMLTVNMNTAWSQKYAFYVMGAKGSPEKRVNNTWSLIKIGDQLQAADEVRVPANGYLGMSHSSGKPLELRDPGSYKVAELAARVGQGNSPLSKYTDFILSTEQDKKNKLSATGAVHRGGTAKIQVHLPATGKADVLGSYFIVTWNSDGSSTYTVTVMDMLENQLGQYQTPSNSLKINLGDLNTASQALLLTVKSGNGNSSDKQSVRILTGEKRKHWAEFERDIAALQQDKSAIGKYMLGNMYESRLLLIDAMTAYKEAADLEPEVYGEFYSQYINRLGYSQ